MPETEEWLECDDEAVGDSAVFLEELRKLAPRWACVPDDTWAFVHENEVRGIVEVVDPGHLVLFSVRVELVGDRLRCHELDLGDQDVKQDHVHFPPLERHGPARELAATAAEWVEHVLNRPLICEEWEWPGGTAQQWVFADTGQLLAGAPAPARLLPTLTPHRRHVRGIPVG